jgi:hypothetical protein
MRRRSEIKLAAESGDNNNTATDCILMPDGRFRPHWRRGHLSRRGARIFQIHKNLDRPHHPLERSANILHIP